MWEAIKNNPVRIYNFILATFMLVAFYVPSIPRDLAINVLIAAFGLGGEITRNAVTPNDRVLIAKMHT